MLIYLFERQKDGEGVFILPVHFPDGYNRPCCVRPKHEPGTPPGLPMWVAGAQALKPSSASSHCISRELVRSLGLEQACSCLAVPQCQPQIGCFKKKVQIFRIWEKVNAIIVLSVHRRSSFIARVSLCACFLHVVSLMFDKHVHLPCPLSSKEPLEKYITFKICLIFINS